MAKLCPKPVGKEIISRYVAESSDFAFELEVQKLLTGCGWESKHGGTYEDPVTGMPREYDIRATKQEAGQTLHLAIECKNVRANFPLVVSTVPRLAHEATHDVLGFRHVREDVAYTPDAALGGREVVKNPDEAGYFLCGHPKLHSDRYPADEPLGKSCDQVGVAAHGEKSISATDSEVYEKWAQAIASGHAWLKELCLLPDREILGMNAVILPVLVVPDDRLWTVGYDCSGRLTGEPSLTNRISYWIGKNCDVKVGRQAFSYRFSHLEIMTESAFSVFANMVPWPSLFRCSARNA